MRIMHVALGGCLKPAPVSYGLTGDTGGHIAYVLGAAEAQARRGDVSHVDIVTRAFDDADLGACYGRMTQRVGPHCTIRRIRGSRSDYVDKADLEAELPALAHALIALIGGMAQRPDVLHAHFSDAAWLAERVRARFGIPWVFSSHSLSQGKPGGPRAERERWAIRHAGAIVASSRDEAERQLTVLDAGAEGRVHRINPGVTVAAAASSRAARDLVAPFLRDADKPVILAIARPVHKKNLVALVEAYAHDPSLRARANLVIVAGLRKGLTGGPSEQDAVIAGLFDAIDRHDLWGHVALPRRHAQTDIASFYALAARGGVFVNPAAHEPFGLTLVEAARAGVPVVATRHGGPGDIVADLGFGALVDPGDPAAIARAIDAMLTHPDRAARVEAAQRAAAALYDWDQWADRARQVYAALTTPRPVSRKARSLFASDIDGTLTGSRAAARRFGAARATMPSDCLFAVATGRSLPEARRVLRDWHLPEPDLFITSVGTEIWHPAGDGALTICDAFADTISQGWSTPGVDRVLDRLGVDRQPDCDQRRWKRSCFGTAIDAARIETALRAEGQSARVVHSHGRLIDILPARAGKAAAIRFELARRGLSARDCVVAGDSGNDRDMLGSFAGAIIPANGDADLVTLTAPYRSPLPFADGVLDGLRHFGVLPAPVSVAAE